jgi:hypothetical protein
VLTSARVLVCRMVRPADDPDLTQWQKLPGNFLPRPSGDLTGARDPRSRRATHLHRQHGMRSSKSTARASHLALQKPPNSSRTERADAVCTCRLA